VGIDAYRARYGQKFDDIEPSFTAFVFSDE
jgi:hypothetical protein